MNLFVVGDVHGCLNELELMFDRIDIRHDPGDKIAFVGDYIDRGPDSKGVVDFLIEKSKSYDMTFIKGNHEDMMMTGTYGWLYNGGVQALYSYGFGPNDITHEMERDFFDHHCPPDHKEFYNNLKLVEKFGKVVVCHAGIHPTFAWDKQDEQTLIWTRDFYNYEGPFKDDVFVVHGHTPRDKNGQRWEFDNRVNIDHGCVFGGHLSCLQIDTETLENVVFSVPAQKKD